MAFEALGLGKGKRAKAVTRALGSLMPEWQVFIRRRNGTTAHHTFTRKHQLWLTAGVSAVAVWAATATLLLAERPAELVAKERQLEEMMASTRASQHRLAASQKMVGEIAREVDSVHANLLVLAESSASLAKDRNQGRPAATVAKVRVGAEPSWNDDGQPGSTEAKAVRDQVRRLESSLERLKHAYSQVVQSTVDMAGNRITDAERSLSKLGLDPQRLIEKQNRDQGRGGPFVPAPLALADGGLSDLLSRMERWAGVKAVMQKLPLTEPLHAPYELNSGFGTRNDPLNHRSGMHEGLDFGAPHGTAVYATGEGMVIGAGPWDRYGLTVDIDHGSGVVTRYAHLSRIKVKPGQPVTRATVIGLVGNTGRSTGAHLHYEVRVAETPRDPLKFISVGRDAPKIR